MAPTATTHGPQAADGPPAIPEPERPRRRRSNRNPATDPAAADGPGVRSPTPRGARRAARPAAGPPPHEETACRHPAAHRATRPPRQPPGVLRGRSRSASAATDARPGGRACGPSRAALKTYRNFEPLRRQPAGLGSSGSGHGMASTRSASYAGGMAALVETARDIARTLLESPLPRRWSHVQAVAARADRISAAVPVEDRDVLVASAWLHDIGYSPGLVDTGFHPLDGGRWLRRERFDERIAALVAHHSCAWLEAEERGLGEVLAAEFPREQTAVTDALCCSDMTTGPDGQEFEVLDRLAEIRSRYGPEHLVTRFIDRAEPEIVAAVQRTERRLAGGVVQPM